MKRILTSLLLAICLCSIALAQDDASDKSKKALAQAAKNGNGLHTQLIVNGNVNAQAVLIPRVDAQRIFGSEIANHYAVIEVNVGNKSPNAALIIHGIFIDYSDWPLSGASHRGLSTLSSPDPDQASSFPNQVASEEYRVVRGQLLDAQTDTFRNTFLRWLTLAGNLAGAFTFSINEQGIVKGIAAATGVGVPGVATAWPDKTIEQLNRVSDFGFRANKVIPKQASEVIVCFFPIDRFLTPGFRKLFLKSPALFFAPLQMLVDKSVEKDVKGIVTPLLTSPGVNMTIDDLRAELPDFMAVVHPRPDDPAYPVSLDHFGLEKVPGSTDGKLRVKVDSNGKPISAAVTAFRKFMILEFLASVSLNRVTVTVDGVMSVDVNTIAARIDEIDIDKVAECGDDAECFWTNVSATGGVRTGVIRGAFLKGGKVALAEQETLGISDLKTIDDGSTDDELHFSFKLGKRIPNQTKLHFTVSKDESVPEGTPAKKLESNTWEFLAAYSPSATAINARTISGTPPSGTTFFGTTLTITGKGFSDAPQVVLHSETGTDIPVTPNATPTPTDTKFDIALPVSNQKFTTGCWRVQVTAGGLTSNSSEWFSSKTPEPTLDSATRTDKAIYLKGKDLINLSKCDGTKISFRLTQGTTVIPLTVNDWNNGEPELVLPDAAKTGTWKVEVLFDGKSLSTVVDKELKAQNP
jgi:hypothetical protein